MIKSLSVKGLNNWIDGELEFNEDLNIITGTNGSGKTTLLKLLWYLISGNLERIVPEIPFDSVSIETDTFSLTIAQDESDETILTWKLLDEEEESMTPESVERSDRILDRLNRRIARVTGGSLFFPTFRRIEGGYSGSGLVSHSDRFFIADMERFPARRPTRRIPDRAMERLHDAMAELSTGLSVYDHKFIASISTRDIVELLNEKYAAISQRTNTLHIDLSKEITQKISATKEQEEAILLLNGIQERVREVAEVRDELLRPFSVLDERIPEIFHYDGIRVTPGIVLGEENEENEAIASDKLSAGEKQMLSFLCYNTFSENAAIFIDEPELSLHVDWQRLLLPTLLEQGTENQFFIATHSPFIYSKYPDKEILLGDDRGDN